MLNREKYTILKTVLNDVDNVKKENFLDAFREELVYELTELYVDNRKEELNKELNSSKRIKKLLSGFAEHKISYQIGTIIGTLQIMELLVHKGTTKNESNIKMSALFEKEINKKILLYLYDHPDSQHKVIAEALGIRPNYLSQQMRELEEAGGVVRYGVDRRSFYELTLDGQAFIEKIKGDERHSLFTHDLPVWAGFDEKYSYADIQYGDISEKQKVLMAGEGRMPYGCGKAAFARKMKEDTVHAK